MNYKKHSFIGLFLLLALLLGSFSQNAVAQESVQRNRIKVSYGDALYTTMGFSIVNAFSGGNIYDFDKVDPVGSFSASYRRLLEGDRWSVGGDFTYLPFHGKSDKGAVDNLDMFLVMAGADCYYMKSGIFRLYGTASAGLMILHESTAFAFQVNPIALRVGSNKFAGFLEVGAGYKGIFNIGLEIGF